MSRRPIQVSFAIAVLLAGLPCNVNADDPVPDRTLTPPPVAAQWRYDEIVFEDDFRDGKLCDVWKKNWRTENNNLETKVRPSAVGFRGAVESADNWLILKAYNTYKSNGQVKDYYAAEIDTRQRPRTDDGGHSGFEHRYGYIEARIKFDTQPGQNSAFWLLSRWNKPENWRPQPEFAPREVWQQENDRDFNTNFGNEVDIIECLKTHRPSGNNVATCDAVPDSNGFIDASRCMIMNIHWAGGPRSPVHRAVGRRATVPAGTSDLIGHWHTYGLLWTRDRYEFYLDGHKMWGTDPDTESHLVSQRPQLLILGTIPNDSNFAGSPPSGGYGRKQHTNALMNVKWVRWWSDTDTPTPPSEL